jgi:hypothetical protein
MAIGSHVVRETELLKANDAVRGRTPGAALVAAGLIDGAHHPTTASQLPIS